MESLLYDFKISDITETAVCGHENHGIPDLDYILTAGVRI